MFAVPRIRDWRFPGIFPQDPFYRRCRQHPLAVGSLRAPPLLNQSDAMQVSVLGTSTRQWRNTSMQLGIAVRWFKCSSTHTHSDAWPAWLLWAQCMSFMSGRPAGYSTLWYSAKKHSHKGKATAGHRSKQSTAAWTHRPTSDNIWRGETWGAEADLCWNFLCFWNLLGAKDWRNQQ